MKARFLRNDPMVVYAIGLRILLEMAKELFRQLSRWPCHYHRRNSFGQVDFGDCRAESVYSNAE
jgi:hypothetical protein